MRRYLVADEYLASDRTRPLVRRRVEARRKELHENGVSLVSHADGLRHLLVSEVFDVGFVHVNLPGREHLASYGFRSLDQLLEWAYSCGRITTCVMLTDAVLEGPYEGITTRGEFEDRWKRILRQSDGVHKMPAHLEECLRAVETRGLRTKANAVRGHIFSALGPVKVALEAYSGTNCPSGYSPNRNAFLLPHDVERDHYAMPLDILTRLDQTLPQERSGSSPAIHSRAADPFTSPGIVEVIRDLGRRVDRPDYGDEASVALADGCLLSLCALLANTTEYTGEDDAVRDEILSKRGISPECSLHSKRLGSDGTVPSAYRGLCEHLDTHFASTVGSVLANIDGLARVLDSCVNAHESRVAATRTEVDPSPFGKPTSDHMLLPVTLIYVGAPDARPTFWSLKRAIEHTKWVSDAIWLDRTDNERALELLRKMPAASTVVLLDVEALPQRLQWLWETIRLQARCQAPCVIAGYESPEMCKSLPANLVLFGRRGPYNYLRKPYGLGDVIRVIVQARPLSSQAKLDRDVRDYLEPRGLARQIVHGFPDFERYEFKRTRFEQLLPLLQFGHADAVRLMHQLQHLSEAQLEWRQQAEALRDLISRMTSEMPQISPFDLHQVVCFGYVWDGEARTALCKHLHGCPGGPDTQQVFGAVSALESGAQQWDDAAWAARVEAEKLLARERCDDRKSADNR